MAHQRARCLQTMLLQYSLRHSSINLVWLADIDCALAQYFAPAIYGSGMPAYVKWYNAWTLA